MIKDLKIVTDLHYSYDSNFYDENFEHIKGDNYIYTDWGQLSEDFIKEDYFLNLNTRSNRIKLIKYLIKEGNCNYNYLKDFKDIFEIIEDNFHEMTDLSNIKEVERLLENAGINFKCGYEKIISRGYSQGDYAQIFVNMKEFKNLTGCDDISDLNKIFDNYLWDCEIVGSLNLSFNYHHNCVPYRVELSYDDFSDFSRDIFEININFDLIISDIKNKMIINLSCDDKELIIKELKKIDYRVVKS